MGALIAASVPERVDSLVLAAGLVYGVLCAEHPRPEAGRAYAENLLSYLARTWGTGEAMKVWTDGPSTPPPVHAPAARRGPPGLPPPPPPLPGVRASRGTAPVSTGLGGMFQPGPTPPPLSASYISASDGTPGVPAPPLYLVFDNQKYRIDKDQFIIGRGAKSSDLPIKDGNISRKHAAVVRRNGTYFIKDLGSTNGIDFKGMRIDNKRIDEGDVFHLCDYELRFTYKR